MERVLEQEGQAWLAECWDLPMAGLWRIRWCNVQPTFRPESVRSLP